MKESEALSRICPYSMAEGEPKLCRASGCMSWHAYESKEFAKRADAKFQKTGERLPLEDGYCRLVQLKPAEAF